MHFFCNVKVTVLLKKLLNSSFDEIFSTVYNAQCDKNETFTCSHQRNISSNQLFRHFFCFVKMLLSRNFCKKCKSKFPKFTPALCWQKFRESNGFDKEITKSWFDEFFSVRVNLSFFQSYLKIFREIDLT